MFKFEYLKETIALFKSNAISDHEMSFEIKGALKGLRQLLATESFLKVMKNGFYFTSKALFVLKIFKFLS